MNLTIFGFTENSRIATVFGYVLLSQFIRFALILLNLHHSSLDIQKIAFPPHRYEERVQKETPQQQQI